MRRGSAVMAAAVAVAALCPALLGGASAAATGMRAAARASAPGGKWGTAREVPGTAALNKGGFAQVTSVSCASAGNCGGGGSYLDAAGHQQAFVVSKP